MIEDLGPLGTGITGLKVLSASKLKVYSSCSRKYYYEYVEKIPAPKHPAACLGSAVHRTIERVYKEKVNPSETFLTTFAAELESSEIAQDTVKPELMRDGLKMVTNYNFERRVPDDIEVEFLLPFPNQAHPLCQIRGFIDQIFPDKLIDLKTNARRPLGSVLDHDPQFIVYVWAFEQIYGYAPNAAIWHHLRTSEDLYSDTVGNLDEVTRLIERILDNELTGVWDKSVGETCRICNYRLPCLGRED